MDAAPRGIDVEAVRRLPHRACPGVEGVHDLHIWALSHHRDGHDRPHPAAPQRRGRQLPAHGLRGPGSARFKIGHATLAGGDGDAAHACRLAPAEVV